MLLKLIIFSLCVTAIKSTGELTILSTPKSLAFKCNEPIQSHDIGEVVYASMGNSISGNSHWCGLTIVDPFHPPKRVFAVSMYGANHSKVSAAGKTYDVLGNLVEQSLNVVTAELKADKERACDISFKQSAEGKLSVKNIIGDVEIPPLANTKFLNGDRTADKQFLESIAYVNAVADNLGDMEKSCDFISISMYVDDLIETHGKTNGAVNEALDLFHTFVKKFNTAAQKYSKNNALVMVVVNEAVGKIRSKRQTTSNDDKTLYNLAEYYSQDYPVIFNIILWFMVVFGFSLLAICYAIGSMDPGRDSIIYRMTSTRMKKDN